MPLVEQNPRTARPIFDFSTKNAKIADWMAEQGEFELPVPILEQPDDSWLFGSTTL